MTSASKLFNQLPVGLHHQFQRVEYESIDLWDPRVTSIGTTTGRILCIDQTNQSRVVIMT